MKILQELRNILETNSKGLDSSDFILHGLWNIDLFFQPNIEERLFQYHLLVSQTLKQGCCYCAEKVDPSELAQFICQDVRTVRTANTAVEIALLDAGFSALPTTPHQDFLLTGTSFEKAMQRADIVVDEIAHLADGMNLKRNPRVLMIGVVGNIVRTMTDRGMDVYATDLDEGLINRDISGVLVKNGEPHSVALISEVDVVLVTGMTLATDTLGTIIEEAKQYGRKVVVYAETGAWFGEAYCQHFGVDAVISEPFPFYIFEGHTQILTYRAEP
ncbi:MAG: DUF364 domain-containing protein [Anaerolineae bacterium]|jgi:hypothetical protein|nr:DUF364 domain-containing protein [Anaerolineae bacterium]